MKYSFWNLFFLKRKSFELDCGSDWLFNAASFLDPTKKNIKLSKKIVNVDRGAFEGCSGIENVFIPKSLKYLSEKSFNKCSRLKNVFIESVKNTHIFSNSFGESIKYLFHIPGQKYAYIASSEPPKQKSDFCVKLSDITKAFGVTRLDKMEKCLYNPFFGEAVKKMSSQKFQMPFSIIRYLIDDNDFEFKNNKEMQEFVNGLDFRFLKNEIPDLDRYFSSKEFGANFLKLAYNLGCFSNEKYINESGVETNIIVAQKASSLLAKFIKSGVIQTSDLCLMKDLTIRKPCSQDFLKFLSVKGSGGEYSNLKLLFDLNEQCNGIFCKVFQNFDKAKRFRVVLSKTGVPKTISWEEALKRFYSVSVYGGLAENESEMAVEFITKGVEKEEFLKAMELVDSAKYYKVNNHILGEPLKETTTLEKIEMVKNQTQKIISDIKNDLSDLYDDMFSFEMLDKHDPRNAILGVYCSCCATLTQIGYGYAIAVNSITDPEIQNLVIRDKNNEIIAKGCMFVNTDYGYAVINDFELNAKYKKGEIVASGVYDNDSYKIDHIKRTKIFETLMRGVYAFVARYNEKYPKRPIRQVNVGWGYNRLKQYVEKCPESKRILPVPQYFEDAMLKQYVLYKDDNPNDAKHIDEIKRAISKSNSNKEKDLTRELKNENK